MTTSGGVLKARVTGYDRSEAATRLLVPGAVRWNAIRWAKASGHRWFDFGGLGESSVRALLSEHRVSRTELAGPDQYKVSFGGSAYRYPPAVELISSPVLRAAYDLFRSSEAGRRVLVRVRTVLRGGRAKG